MRWGFFILVKKTDIRKAIKGDSTLAELMDAHADNVFAVSP